MNFLRAYLEAIKIIKTEREYSIKALAQFTRVQNLKAVQEGYDYFVKQLEPVPYPSVRSDAGGSRPDRRNESKSEKR